MTIDSGDFDSSGFDFEEPNDGDNEEGGSRLFIILAVGLAGLIVLGLVAIGGVLMLRNIRSQQTLAQVTPQATPTLAIVEQAPTATATPTTPPTTTPSDEALPNTPTSTSVVQEATGSQDNGQASGSQDNVQAGGATPAAIESTPTSTNTPIVPTGTPVSSSEVPDTGFGGFELALIAIGLIAVLFVARRLRQQAI